MQYPIIDLIANAYMNNGWTGLDIVESKNLIHIYNKTQTIDGITVSSENGVITIDVPQTASTSYQFVFDIDSFIIPASINNGGNGVLYLFNNFVNNNISFNFFNNQTRVEQWNASTINRISSSYTAMQNKITNSVVIQINASVPPLHVIMKPMMTDDGVIYDDFITPFNFDFPNRLKLPLPHYFPHPVIDSLQRAAAGTQTADDTEILRHYLTPLGIGGI